MGLKVENTTRFAKALAAEGYDSLDAFDDGIDYNSYANRHNLPANTNCLTSWLSTGTASYQRRQRRPKAVQSADKVREKREEMDAQPSVLNGSLEGK